MPEFYMILARKIIKIPEILLYLPEKCTKFPNFTWFLPENARILHNNCPKKYFSRILGGHVPRLPPPPPPPPPVSYAYEYRAEPELRPPGAANPSGKSIKVVEIPLDRQLKKSFVRILPLDRKLLSLTRWILGQILNFHD